MQFVPTSDIDARFFDSPYYIVPNDKVGQDAFAVIRDAMKAKGLSPNDVVNAMSVENLILPAGTSKIGGTEYDVDLNASPYSRRVVARLGRVAVRAISSCLPLAPRC